MADAELRAVEPGPGPPGALLCAAAAGHTPALRRFFARRAPPAEVDDSVQDVFLRLQACRPSAPVVDAEAYLFATARHVLASRQRRLARQGSARGDAAVDAGELRSDLSPERIVGARQDYARAMAAVDSLPPRARAAFRLHRFEELSYAGIAERMGISRGSVKELLRRACARVGGAREYSTPAIPPEGTAERH